MTQSLKRKLAVILHADVVDSTRLVQNNDVEAHKTIQTTFGELEYFVDNHDGITHERRGDALVAEFSRASDAVAAALEFQQDAGKQLDNNEFNLAVRIGISLGEVIIADSTITGAGVVLAQRLEQIAASGEVVVQASVAETVPDYLPYQFEDLGDLQLKGFDAPIRAHKALPRQADNTAISVQGHTENNTTVVPDRNKTQSFPALYLAIGCCVLCAIFAVGYWLTRTTTQPTAATSSNKAEHSMETSRIIDTASVNTPTEQLHSIAVLPFKNLSPTADDEYLSDGMTEDLITDLSSLSDLLVIARNSVFVYKQKEISSNTIAEELGVRYVLGGSLRRADKKLRINVVLTDTTNNTEIWAERYDRQISDIFELQNEISQTIVKALAIKLTRPEEHLLAKQATNNLEAYDYYQRGRSYTFSNQNSLAQENLEMAIKLDPQFTEAYSALSFSHAITVTFGTTDNIEEEMDTLFRLATQAVSMDNNSPQALYSLAYAFLLRGQHKESVDTAQRAIDSTPNYASAHGIHGWALTLSGQYEKALESLNRAVKLQPKANGIILGVLGATYYLLDRFDEAASLLEASIETNPETLTSHAFLAATYLQLERPDDASWEAEELLLIDPDFKIKEWRWIEIFKDQHDPRFLRLINDLESAGLPTR